MLNFKTANKRLIYAINEVLKELPHADELDFECEISAITDGLSVSINQNNALIEYSDVRSLMRAISILYANRNRASFSVKEKPAYTLLGAMPDASRNAVPTIDTLKKFCRIIALEGYNALMLYTEDTYEIEGRPYFGHLRGRYTKAELKELDDYANMLGIELIPAIQTLAHLNGMFEWPAAYELQDCNDIMLVGEEKVYEFIDEMLSTMANTLRTRKINIGLDEARMLGSGTYLNKNGYKKRFMIMADHLKRVKELCLKHGFEARIWSDMFFRMLNDGVYRVKGTVVPQEIVDSVPPELTLVYWDYIQSEVENYDEMFKQHKAFNNPIAFAGGDASWYGLIPLNVLGKRSCLCATESIRKNNIKEVYITMWGDDGASCSLFSTLHNIFIYGEACWDEHDKRENNAIERLDNCLGISESILLDLEHVHATPGRTSLGRKVANPSKYMLYNNILTGKFDAHIAEGTNEHMTKMSKHLKEERHKAGEYTYVIDSIIALCDVLSVKSELGKTIRAAYLSNDKEKITSICENEIPESIALLNKFKNTLRYQWNKENKLFGFDVIAMRLGGTISQLETASLTLKEWVNGTIKNIEELEADRLPYLPDSSIEIDGGVIQLNRWERMAGQNISNMFGFA